MQAFADAVARDVAIVRESAPMGGGFAVLAFGCKRSLAESVLVNRIVGWRYNLACGFDQSIETQTRLQSRDLGRARKVPCRLPQSKLRLGSDNTHSRSWP
jgi:hypothetical protein